MTSIRIEQDVRDTYSASLLSACQSVNHWLGRRDTSKSEEDYIVAIGSLLRSRLSSWDDYGCSDTEYSNLVRALIVNVLKRLDAVALFSLGATMIDHNPNIAVLRSQAMRHSQQPCPGCNGAGVVYIGYAGQAQSETCHHCAGAGCICVVHMTSPADITARCHGEWIAVSEALPLENEAILGVIQRPDGGRQMNMFCFWQGEWHVPGTSFVSENQVTHWMPLPVLPK